MRRIQPSQSKPAGAPLGRDAPDAQEPPPSVDRGGSLVALRLAIGKDGLGIELARKVTSACLEVVELVVRLPQVRFPFDVTGGVAKFRHKRGLLERLAVELDARRFARWATPRLRGLLGPGACEVSLAPRAFGGTVTVLARPAREPESEAHAWPSALAFEIAVVPTGGDVALIVHGARGARLPEPATALALRAVSALLGDAARREGARFVLDGAAERLGRALMPDAGVRAPDGSGVLFVGCGENDGVLFGAFARSGAVAAVPEEAALANELAMLTRGGDDARFAGDYDQARTLDLDALERAPRHPEIARRIAEIDARAGGRAEAALATLREAGTSGRTGALVAELHVEAGDRRSAIATLLREGEREASNAVASLVLARAAELAEDPADALDWLDGAVARTPRLAELRWERAHKRLASGRLDAARADFQELEALAAGSRRRFAVLRRAGDIYRAVGLGKDAAILYERALLYRPDDPETLAGLGAAIAAEGRAPRGAALLAHAIEAAGEKHTPTAWMDLELGRVLGDRLHDRSAAVARLRAIADEAPEAIEARALEGRYRSELGDVAGASLAFARLRERAGREPQALPWLLEAARFEEARGDLHAAQRHLAAALAIAPRDPDATARYRAIGERLAAALPYETPAERVEAPIEPAVNEPEPADVEAPSFAEPTDEAEAEARIASLTRILEGDPTNDTVIDELVFLLTRLGRGMELLALLSARLEDAPADRRAELLPRHREVLASLEHEARTAGRDAEADLFRLAREMS